MAKVVDLGISASFAMLAAGVITSSPDFQAAPEDCPVLMMAWRKGRGLTTMAFPEVNDLLRMSGHPRGVSDVCVLVWVRSIVEDVRQKLRTISSEEL